MTDEVVLAVDMLDMLRELGYNDAYLLPNDGRLVPVFVEDDYNDFCRTERYGDILAAYGDC